MCGAYKVGVNLLLCQPEADPYPARYGLLRHQSQRHVYTVECHPVNLFLPAAAVPVRHGVAIRHHVQVIVVAVGRFGAHRCFASGKLRHHESVARP